MIYIQITIMYVLLTFKLINGVYVSIIYLLNSSLYTNHTSSVKFKYGMYPSSNICSGLPHGYVIGPLLFLIYLRPQYNIITKLSKINYHI